MRGEKVDLASRQISHGFEFPIIRAKVRVGIDMEICIAARAAIVDKVKDIEMRTIRKRIEARFKI